MQNASVQVQKAKNQTLSKANLKLHSRMVRNRFDDGHRAISIVDDSQNDVLLLRELLESAYPAGIEVKHYQSMAKYLR